MPPPPGSMLSRPFRNNPSIQSYREALRWAARSVGLLHTLSTFLAFCSLTWATVVLLGAFVSDLQSADYYFIIALLLLEAARLASTAFFTQIVTRSPEPGHLNQEYAASADFSDEPHCAHRVSPCFQVLLIAPSFICAIIRLLKTRSYDPHSIDHLQISIRIFYIVIIVNAIVSSLTLILSLLFMAWIGLKYPSELSVLRYYSEVLQKVLVSGVIQADNFNFFQYAFRILGREHARCAGWETVVAGYKMLLTYIYAHKQGADYLRICLDSEDASVRQAAANMVGMWADEKRGLGLKEELDLPPELLTKLADMVGFGEVGWAATNSFGALATRNPQYLLQTLTSSKEPVLHRIAQLVNESSTRTLASVRTLVRFYIQIFLRTTGAVAEPQNTTGRVLPEAIEAELVSKLKHLLEWSAVHRLRVHSAYLLYLLGKLGTHDRCYELIRAIKPKTDMYWYAMEKKMLQFLLKYIGHYAPPSYPTVYPDLEVVYEGEA